jgi:hypothetical protein
MSSQLLTTEDKFTADIVLRIAEGQAILKQYNPAATEEEFRKLHRALERWSKNNHSWLGHIFSKDSSYQRDYENAGAWDTEKLLAARNMSPDSLRYKSKFFRQSITPKIEYLEDLLDTIDFLPTQQEQSKLTPPLSTMNNDEIAKKEAQDAVTVALRYSIHHEVDKCSATIIDRSTRLYKPADKTTYFQEAIRLINEKILQHRSTCKEGAGCYTEKQHEHILFYLQQELDKLDTSITNSLPVQSADASFTASTGIEKIFISHSSKDATVVEEIVDLLEIIGVTHEQIFCSSLEGYSIGLGQDFLQRIKDELNGNVLVLFVITPNFYSSPVSLCEMGAAWVKTTKHIPIVVPPLSYEDVKGVIPLTQGFKINEPLKWNTLKEQLEEWFGIKHSTSSSVWERKRDKAIQAIGNKIQLPTSPPQRAKVRNLKKGGSTT